MWKKHDKQDDNQIYNLSSLSGDASSVSSVKLVIICGDLENMVLKTWTVILLSMKVTGETQDMF